MGNDIIYFEKLGKHISIHNKSNTVKNYELAQILENTASDYIFHFVLKKLSK